MTSPAARRVPRQLVLDRAAERVTAMVPGLDRAAAAEFVARAVSGPTLRPSQAHLAAHSDALTSGSSAAPVVVQVLAGLLAAAGHAVVRIPRCHRCGDQRLLRHLVDGGRVCDSCRYHVRLTPCGVCGRNRAVAGRDEQGRPRCDTCRIRKTEPCSQCGLLRAVNARRDDGSPVCVNCYQTPKRQCCRCGQTKPTYAHTPAGPLCEGCYQQPRRRCGGCGHIRSIDRRATETDPDLCGRCLTRPRRTCTICGTSHPVTPRARQPICLTCRDAGHTLEPDLTEASDRRRRRRHETAHDALAAKLATVLTHADRGIAEQIKPLFDVFDRVRNPAATMQWLHDGRGGARLLGELAERAHHEPITHELLDRSPQSYALHRTRALLVHAGILPERDDELLNRIEPWLDNLLTQQPAHHASLIRPFAAWHLLRRARHRARRGEVTTNAASYLRSQIRISLQFLAFLDERDKDLSTSNQADLDQWLDHAGQYGCLLRGFIAWATEHRLCTELSVPYRRHTDPGIVLDEDTRWDTLCRCLRDHGLPLPIRATGALVLLYGRTATTIARLTVADIAQINGETHLNLDGYAVPLPPAVATLIDALREANTSTETFHRSDPATRFLFPARSPGAPAAAHVLRRNLRQHGIDPRPARHSARAAWARDIPPPIAADVLGIDITTATRWASRTRRDWTDYLAARAEHQLHDSHDS